MAMKVPNSFLDKIPSEERINFTLGQRGCMLLVHNGFTFVKNRRSGYKTYWICSKKGSTKCRARVVTNIIDGVQKVILTSFEHNHPIVPERKKRLKSLDGRKKKIKTLKRRDTSDSI